MSVSLQPELSFIAPAGMPKGKQAMSKRAQCEVLRAQLNLEAGTFRAHWGELNDNILPRRGRFQVTDVNKGDRRNSKIIDSTATSAVRTLSAGMMAGVTSPARPWFLLTTGDAPLDESPAVSDWLHEVRERMLTVFRRSNLYNKLPILYGDIGTFGTGAMAVLDDDETVIRCYDFPVGSYACGNDAKMRVRLWVRAFRLTVQQIVERWGHLDPVTGLADFQRDPASSAISSAVQALWKSGTRGAWFDIVHAIQPNLSYDGRKIDAKYKRYESMYYELGNPNQPVLAADYGLLEHGGFDEFPILVARWETNSEDIYATNCPGMTALGDIKQLQTGERRELQAVEKMINPPLIGPPALKQAKVSMIPGDITYHEQREGMTGLRPIHEVNFGAAFGPMETKQQQVRLRIQRAFYEDLFLMLSQSDRREITAREIDERHEEKLLALGPMLEQLNQDVLDPLIERVFNIMARKGLIPPPPPEIQGAPFTVEYVSIMAQAQKQVGLAAIERFASFAMQVAQGDPSVLDDIDVDELIQQYADATGIPPKILKDPKLVAQIRQQKQQAAQAQQMADAAPKVAGAAKDLSQSPTSGDNALAQLLGKTRARQTIGATASPPAPVIP